MTPFVSQDGPQVLNGSDIVETSRLFVAPSWLTSVMLAGQGSGCCCHGLVAYFGGSGKEAGHLDTSTISLSKRFSNSQNLFSVWAPGKSRQSNPLGLGGAVLRSSQIKFNWWEEIQSNARTEDPMHELAAEVHEEEQKTNKRLHFRTRLPSERHSWPAVPAGA